MTLDALPPYLPPKILFNGHLQTIFPALLRKVEMPKPFERVRLKTEDEDFLDLDRIENHNKKVVIISHGLEGDSQRPYMRGMANEAVRQGFDVIAWNYRGCSGEINQQRRMYHSGATGDLRLVVKYAAQFYEEINLVGFSLGGNLTLKFTGENDFPDQVKKSCGIAVPLDLRSGAVNLSSPKNFLYQRRFMKSLINKASLKHEQFPDLFDLERVSHLKTVYDFDDMVTAPVHGFENAEDYYQKCSSRNFVDRIEIPTLILNAYNDPFLTPEILDSEIGAGNPNVTHIITEEGGHCGYPIFGNGAYWSEKVAINFFKEG